jgi:3-isopropylmalate/(R)-2-methylmalate dehydratase small subunit
VSRQPFTTITGVAVPLLLNNVDTDVIIRVERMTSVKPDVLAPWAFEALRYRPDGTDDPTCVLNDPRYRGAPILLAGANFGCGSSREPAVWAIMGLGVRGVIAPSFGDIFRGNCLTNGLLPVVLDEAAVNRLADLGAAGEQLTVDLQGQQVRAGGETWPFEIGVTQRMALLEGLDDLDLALRFAPSVAAWEHKDRQSRPWAWAATTGGDRE